MRARTISPSGHGNDDDWHDHNGPLYGGISCFLSLEGFGAATDHPQGKTLNKDMLLKTNNLGPFRAGQ